VLVLPIVAGPSTVESVAEVIAAAVSADDGETAVLCSTDLSHYLDDASARAQDADTMAAVERLDPGGIGTRDACGVYALRGLLGWAAGTLTPTRLDYSTSADTGGDRARVVGYCAYALT
jgi:AmmeMemoRadiSam system protein B